MVLFVFSAYSFFVIPRLQVFINFVYISSFVRAIIFQTYVHQKQVTRIITSSHQKPLMIICTEKDILIQLENNNINRFASKNEVLMTFLVT